MSRQRPLADQIESIKISDDVHTLMRWHEHDHLTCLQVAVMLLVLDNPGCSTGALAEALNKHKPAITRAVHKLTLLGLLRFRTDNNDRRMVKIYATEKAK